MDDRHETMPPDWRAAVRRQAANTESDLPEDVVDELALHLEDLVAADVARGVAPDEARRRGEQLLAGSDLLGLRRRSADGSLRLRAGQAALEARSHRRPGVVSLFVALRVAVRQLRRHPSFALVTLLVLGLAVGAVTTVFSIVDAVLLRPLSYEAPDRLVRLRGFNAEKGLADQPISPVNFVDDRALPVFQDAAAWWRPAVNLVDPGLDPVRVTTVETTPNLFDVLGVEPQLGSGFPDGGALFVDNEPVAVISDRLWRRRYGGDPAILGRQLALNGTPYTVVGVMPPGFAFPDGVDVWQRMSWDPAQHSRGAHFMGVVARLAPRVRLGEAQAAATSLGQRLGSELPDTNGGWTTRLVPLLDDLLGYYRPALLVLVGAVVLLLAIAVLNVASLLLTRALSREREMAIRVSAGASPRQLLVQLMAESLVLSLGGVAVGVLAAAVALPLCVRLAPVEIPRLAAASVSLRALGVSVGVVVVTTLVFGLVPAQLLLWRRLGSRLRTSERGASRPTRRLYAGLVTGEVALACALLVGSALLVRTVHGMMTTDLGVDADPVVTTSMQVARPTVDPDRSLTRLEVWQRIADLQERLLDEIRHEPGVLSAGTSNFLPFEEGWRVGFAVDQGPVYADSDDAPQAQIHTVSDGWFETMGARLSSGRPLRATDTRRSPGVAVVNRSFAEAYLGGDRPVGRRVTLWATGIGPLGKNLEVPDSYDGDGIGFEVVGVVEDVRNAPLGQAVEPAIYFSSQQFPFSEQTLAVRAVDRAAAAGAVRDALHRVAPGVPVGTIETWGERVAARTAEPRLLMWLLSLFGALAAVLAAAGVYGLFSWSVAMRRRELAIRLALGADPPGVARLVAGQSIALVGGGLLVGLAIVRASRPALERVVYGISPTDGAATLVAVAVLSVAAALACLPPVLRAMRVDPTEGLRAD